MIMQCQSHGLRRQTKRSLFRAESVRNHKSLTLLSIARIASATVFLNFMNITAPKSLHSRDI